jgi:hypothetical protein
VNIVQSAGAVRVIRSVLKPISRLLTKASKALDFRAFRVRRGHFRLAADPHINATLLNAKKDAHYAHYRP